MGAENSRNKQAKSSARISPAKSGSTVFKGGASRPYHLRKAEMSLLELRQLVVVKLAQHLQERGWTQAQAAKHLGVSQPRISDLIRGQAHKFTLDTLLEWLFALGQPVQLSLSDTASGAGRRQKRQADEDAVAYYTRVLALDPLNGTAYLNRGLAYLALNEFALAVGDFTRCFELEPERPGALNNRALAYIQSGHLKAALLDCEKLNLLHPDYSHGFAQKGQVLVALERYSDAISAYTQAIALDPERPGYYMGRASVYAALAQYGNAFVDYAHTLRVDPSYEPARQASRELRKKISG